MSRNIAPVKARLWSVRAWFAAYLAFVGAHTVLFAWLLANGLSNYIVGDWLINYSGGFVRRGLVGSFILASGHVLGVPLYRLVFGVQAVAFAVLLVCFYRLTRGLRWTPLIAAVLLSPAGIGFTVVDTFAGLRKEVLLFAALALFLCLVERVYARAGVSPNAGDWEVSATLTVLLVVVALSHEALIVCAPYFLAGLAVYVPVWRRVLRICAVPAVATAAALLAVATHPGNLRLAQAVCSSLGETLYPLQSGHSNLCSGSIGWLPLSLAQARQIFVPVLAKDHFVRFYGLIAVPVFAPLVAAFLGLWHRDPVRRTLHAALCCAVLSLLGTAFLCYTAMDWGRWMHMQVMCMTLLLVVLERRTAPAPGIPHAGWRRAAAGFAVAVYATVWTLPSIYPHVGHGYIDLAAGWAHTLHHLHDPAARGFFVLSGAPR